MSGNPQFGKYEWDDDLEGSHGHRRAEVIQHYMRRQHVLNPSKGPVLISRYHYQRVCPKHGLELEDEPIPGRESLLCPAGHRTTVWNTLCKETGEIDGRWTVMA